MSKHEGKGEPRFPGFRSPSYTMVPDELFDELLPELTGTELKVLLYIIRRTFGFKRDSDTISLSQMLSGITTKTGRTLDHGAGVSKGALLPALRSLREKNIILSERQQSTDRGNEPTLYRLNVQHDPLGTKNTLPLVQKLDQGGGAETGPRARCKKRTTQETVEQQTVVQETENVELSNIRRVEPEQDTPKANRSPGAETTIKGIERVGDILARAHAPAVARSRPRPETLDEDYQRLQDCIEDRAREFNDTASLKASTTRAWRLFQRSGLPIEAFTDRVFQARALTQERTAAITKTAADADYGVRRKSKMAYFFAVLEDQLGLAPPRAKAAGSGSGPPAGAREPEDYSAFVQH